MQKQKVQQMVNNYPVRNATLMPLRESVKMIIGSDEKIFDEDFCYVYNAMNRIVKVRKDALQFGNING